MNTTLDESVLVYSSYNLGVDIQDIDLDYIPRVIEISLFITLTNFVAVYDDLKIQELVQQNQPPVEPVSIQRDQPTSPGLWARPID